MSEYKYKIELYSHFHHEGHQGLGFIKTKTLPENSFELADILKYGEFTNCISGYELKH